MENVKEQLIKEAKRIEEDSLYSAKGHFVAASFWRNFHLWIGVPTAIFAGIAGVSSLGNHNIIAGILAILVAALVAVTTFLNPNGRANSHLTTGNKYNALRNKARLFYEIISYTEVSSYELTNQLKELAEKREELNLNSPQIPRRAFEKARRGIEEGEANYKVDENNKN